MRFQAIEELNETIKENVLLEDIKDVLVDYETIHGNKNIRVLWETGIRLDIAIKFENRITLLSFELKKIRVEVKPFTLLKEDLEWIYGGDIKT